MGNACTSRRSHPQPIHRVVTCKFDFSNASAPQNSSYKYPSDQDLDRTSGVDENAAVGNDCSLIKNHQHFPDIGNINAPLNSSPQNQSIDVQMANKANGPSGRNPFCVSEALDVPLKRTNTPLFNCGDEERSSGSLRCEMANLSEGIVRQVTFGGPISTPKEKTKSAFANVRRSEEGGFLLIGLEECPKTVELSKVHSALHPKPSIPSKQPLEDVCVLVNHDDISIIRDEVNKTDDNNNELFSLALSVTNSNRTITVDVTRENGEVVSRRLESLDKRRREVVFKNVLKKESALNPVGKADAALGKLVEAGVKHFDHNCAKLQDKLKVSQLNDKNIKGSSTFFNDDLGVSNK